MWTLGGGPWGTTRPGVETDGVRCWGGRWRRGWRKVGGSRAGGGAESHDQLCDGVGAAERVRGLWQQVGSRGSS